jgi:hypothetical protein
MRLWHRKPCDHQPSEKNFWVEDWTYPIKVEVDGKLVDTHITGYIERCHRCGAQYVVPVG